MPATPPTGEWHASAGPNAQRRSPRARREAPPAAGVDCRSRESPVPGAPRPRRPTDAPRRRSRPHRRPRRCRALGVRLSRLALDRAAAAPRPLRRDDARPDATRQCRLGRRRRVLRALGLPALGCVRRLRVAAHRRNSRDALRRAPRAAHPAAVLRAGGVARRAGTGDDVGRAGVVDDARTARDAHPRAVLPALPVGQQRLVDALDRGTVLCRAAVSRHGGAAFRLGHGTRRRTGRDARVPRSRRSRPFAMRQ